MAGVAEAIPEAAVAGGPLSRLARAQYAALAAMRWSVFRNSMRTAKGAVESGARAVTLILFSLMGLGIAFGLGAAADAIAANNAREFLPLLFWVVLLLWQLLPITMASFQEQFDTNGLLRFPVGFGAYFLLHLVFGLVDSSTIVGTFCCVGIFAGFTLARPELAGWMAVALTVFAVFNILLVRAILAWIDRWLAQRRTREIVTAIFFVGVLGIQLANPALRAGTKHGAISDRTRVEGQRWLHAAEKVQRWLPPGLGAAAVSEGKDAHAGEGLESLALLGVFTLAAGAALGARLHAEYRGESLGEAPSPQKRERRQGQWLIDGSGPIAAVMEKELRTLKRAMNFLYAIALPLVMVFVFSGIRNLRNDISHRLPFGLLISLVYAFLGFTQLFYNNLGPEGPGIQLLFLSPTPIRKVMLAKNLFHALLFLADALVAGALACWRFGMPSPVALAATIAWLLFALPVHLAAGDIFSLTMAYRVNLGRIGRQGGSQANALLSLLVQVGVLGLSAAVFAVSVLTGKLWIATPLFLLLAAGSIFAWMRILNRVDGIANARRDDLIATLARAE
jgi:ABC-2 type transport system permease protein